MKKTKIVICVLLVLVLFTGCKPNQSISKLSIAQGIAIDKNDDKIEFSVQYLDLSKGTGTTDTLGRNITNVVTVIGDDISSAVAKTSTKISGSVYFGQNRVIVFGDDFAKSTLSRGIDYVLRGVDSRVDVLVAMSERDAKAVLKSDEGKTKVPAQSVCDTIKSGEQKGFSISVTANDLLNYASTKTSDIYMPVLSTKNDKTTTTGIAIFSEKKLVKFLNDDEVFGFVILKNRNEGGSVVIKDEKLGVVGLTVAKCKTKNSSKIQDGNLCFVSNIKANLVLDDVQKGVVTTVSPKDLKRLEKSAQKRIEEICTSAASECFNYKSDPFLFSKNMAKSYPKFYRENEDNWRELLPNTKVKVSAKVTISALNNTSIK